MMERILVHFDIHPRQLWLLSRTESFPIGLKVMESTNYALILKDTAAPCLALNSYKKIAPKVANDVKLISSGKILENSKTVSQCKMSFGELGLITMHAVVQPSLAKVKTEKKIDEAPQKNCACTIM
ncbi:membrane-anchored ubiquitin-fold protein 3 isoform X1 [Daucus carota subsp. sativus]|uniref:membrane-anchored ubiquitin-fold protein 3 isoform X1 n=1 Tax=Daucus carota subsp. sativus TaxID=79200 RepID=UPI0007EFB7CC|nr:PREDICTED: membrane-anchored ubiquitin-fold protein 3 isoform X1 [Daucus carota subsp. sativus]XP_017229967.1 PREDICTED: membrane-anchored ubiquitin-fold protein 3 isoform X1 [Daucus carota subsp. sativus]XP_017229968.1 PREDICTED: membrane-anchored ubiquitin-fold protein 3 isoform X1 [Daucus carota subsp. sativus]